MAKPFEETPQPAIDRDRRRSEGRPALIGLVLSLVGILLIVGGLLVVHHVTSD